MTLGVLMVVLSTMVQSLCATTAVNVNSTSPPQTDVDNHTANTTAEVLGGSSYADWQVALIVVACGLLVVGTIIGNALVVTAVVIARRLRTPSNLLIVSLAISDLLVAILDMPFAAMYEVNHSDHYY